jgi:hypothetical protein
VCVAHRSWTSAVHAASCISIHRCRKVCGAGGYSIPARRQFWPVRTSAMQDPVYELPRTRLLETVWKLRIRFVLDSHECSKRAKKH